MEKPGSRGNDVVPQYCKGAVVVNEGPNFHVEVQTLPVPEIGPEDVLIKLNVTGICFSDLHYMLNDWPIPKMSELGTRCPGHEGAGTIVKVGERVKRLKVGMRAGVKPIADTCGVCEYCRGGMEVHCEDSVMTGLHVDGTYKEYFVSPERYTTIIPDAVPDYIAAPWAVFLGGGGGVGIQGVQLAKAIGLRPVVVDTGLEKQKLALSLGAEAFVDFRESSDVAAEVVRICDGKGAHGVFCTAPQSYPTSSSYLGKQAGGTIMCIGIPPVGACHIDLDPTTMILQKVTIKGTMVSSQADIDATLGFAARGLLKLQPEIVGWSGFNDACQRLRKGLVPGRIVVDFSKK
ncbi:hypothetical protein PV10_09212 [Exophiala mesophila]|uniref:Enoyl reductase (ER) domain-containing protein n=1 Tax=Exophiala mesophila TaxID=212818 RepID=A0A0D1ZMR8_EXOME|nr:uncharacterized protein PV10_09212 [Exophiala mesophila]KIV88038.1 hypothetical protein PV10_09212 [Exophiala mesophila]